MKSNCYLFREEHIPEKAAFAVIDAHNHMWGRQSAETMVEVMDCVGVVSYCNLTPEAWLTWQKGEIEVEKVEKAGMESFLADFAERYPGRGLLPYAGIRRGGSRILRAGGDAGGRRR